jgi:hypothetical protein
MRYPLVIALVLTGCASSASSEHMESEDDADDIIEVLARDAALSDGSIKMSPETDRDASSMGIGSSREGGSKQSGGEADGSSAMGSAADASVSTSATADAGVKDASRPAPTPDASGARPTGSAPVTLPPRDGKLDYQLGLAYPPPSGARIVTRDRTAAPAPGVYNICYVNGFQAQEADERFWLTEHPDLLLRDSSGSLLIDEGWDEPLLDVSSADKRDQLAVIVGGWISECARSGYDAVEIDNLDSYTRSDGHIAEDDAVAFLAKLALTAHAEGLAIAQKNASELVPRRDELGTDFVVAEECNEHEECDVYIQGYEEQVLMIEYQQSAFDEGCTLYPEHSITLRDLELTGPSSADYVYDDC